MNIYKSIKKKWMEYAPELWWGDSLDVRFYLCNQILNLHNKKILDVGCNAGIIISCLNTDNDVYGIDLNENALNIAKKLNPPFTFIRTDMFKISERFKKEEFDVIILSHVLPKDNFASDKFPEELMDVIMPLLKRNGKLYLTTPSVERCYNRKSKFINRPYLDALFQRYKLHYYIKHWCPWNIHLNRFLQFIPGIFNILIWLSKYQLRSVSFYAEAIKK